MTIRSACERNVTDPCLRCYVCNIGGAGGRRGFFAGQAALKKNGPRRRPAGGGTRRVSRGVEQFRYAPLHGCRLDQSWKRQEHARGDQSELSKHTSLHTSKELPHADRIIQEERGRPGGPSPRAFRFRVHALRRSSAPREKLPSQSGGPRAPRARAATRRAARRRAAGGAIRLSSLRQPSTLPRRSARPVCFARSPGHVHGTNGSFGRRRGRGRGDQRGNVEIRLDPRKEGGAEVRKMDGMRFGVDCDPGALPGGDLRARLHRA